MTRIVVADDHQVVRNGFAELLGTQEDLEVVATAADGAEVVRMCRQLQPDIVLMDVRMPGMDGIEATRQLVSDGNAPRVIILTTFDLDEYVYDALRAGASGFRTDRRQAANGGTRVTLVRHQARSDGLQLQLQGGRRPRRRGHDRLNALAHVEEDGAALVLDQKADQRRLEVSQSAEPELIGVAGLLSA